MLIIAGRGTEAEAARLSERLRAIGHEPRLLQSPGPTTPLPDGPFRAQLWLGLDAQTAAIAGAAKAQHPGAPVVAIGGEPPCAANLCLRAVPSPELWEGLWKELVPRPATAPAVRWRRKGDMIIGHSRATQELLRVLDRLAPSSAPVLVTGESGTGKELVARALHFSGPRVAKPFIALNCAAIPEALVEAELFGHQRGAFTGAVSQRIGAFEAAHQGTLFLDEIGEMPLQHQAKLLRVLESSEISRLGSNSVKKVNVRVVAATNRELAREVSAGRFREDLYYRLRVYPVHLEPLRNRPEDIPPIIDHHLAMIGAREHRPLLRLTPAALEKVLGHSWPGNVRELVNVLERASLVAQGTQVEAEDLALPTAEGVAARTATAAAKTLAGYREARTRFEADYFVQLLKTAGGNVSLAAKLAKKTRKQVYDALKRLGLDAVEYRQR